MAIDEAFESYLFTLRRTPISDGRAQRHLPRRWGRIRPVRPGARAHGHPRGHDVARLAGAESRRGRSDLDPREFSRLAVRALPPGDRVLERIHQSATGEMVRPLQDLDVQVRSRWIDRDRARGCAADGRGPL